MHILNPEKGNNDVITEHESGESSNCLHESTMVKMQDGKFKMIKNIQINDITSKGKVYGIYKCNAKFVNWITYNGNIIGSRVIVRDKNSSVWRKMYNMGEPIYIENCEYGYHLITHQNQLELENGFETRDFLEITCNDIQNETFNLVEKHLNSSIC